MLTPSAKSLSALPVRVAIVPTKSILAAAALPMVVPKDFEVEVIAILLVMLSTMLNCTENGLHRATREIRRMES